MSRNKYPEETYQLIINVSKGLFLKNGYEKTSLQDIIEHLGGLTKGAIYHHFKSKEEILIAVLHTICNNNATEMGAIRDDRSLNGKQKLEKMFTESLKNPNQKDVFAVTPNLLNNPTFLVYYLKMITQETVPQYVLPIIKQGIADGSIIAKYPEELADAILFLSDVWMNPLVFPLTEEKLVHRAIMLNEFFSQYGIQILDENMIDRMRDYRKISEDRM